MINPTLKHRHCIWVSVIFGTLTTLFSYSFGNFDHIEQLPILYRTLDSDYLVNDFFVNANQGFSPRFYYSQVISLFSTLGGIPLLFFIGTLFSNALIAILSYLSAQELFNSKEAGIIAAGLVMTLPLLSLGSDVVLYGSMFTPTTLVFPLILLSFYLFLKNKLFLSVICLGITSIFHVLIGLEYGVLFISTSIVLDLLKKRSFRGILKKSSLFIVLALFLSINLIPHFQNRTSIDSDLFIEIIAHFRHPHHYILSEILDLKEFVSLLLTAVLTVIILYTSKKKLSPTKQIRSIKLMGALILIAVVFGWFFTEIIPLKSITTLQTLRMVNLLKWILLLFLSQFIYEVVKKNRIGLKEIIVALCALGLIFISDKSLIKTVGIAILYSGCILLTLKNRIKILSFGFIVVVTLLTLTNSNYFADVNPYRKHYLSAYPLEKSKADLVKFIKQNTDENTVFMTPHDFGFIRTEAKRAIVVDFKAFPFPESAMKEWYQRIQDCYGLEKNNFIDHYKDLDQKDLLELKNKYGFQYAVLYQSNKTDFPILFSNSEYKIIALTTNVD